MAFFICQIVNNSGLASVVLPVVAVIMAIISVAKVSKLAKLKRYFRKSMILVPLYKNRMLAFVFSMLFFIVAVASVLLAVSTGQVLIFVSLAVCALSSFWLVSGMGSVRFAVVDAGVLIPYRFIPWHELYDYYLDENVIIFSGDRHGRRTLSSTTIKMRFNTQDAHKLRLVLQQNRVKHKRD